jgi:hypothetical protein
VVYGSVDYEDVEMLEMLEACGVDDIFSEPFTLAHLKDVMDAHKSKLRTKMGMNHEPILLAMRTPPPTVREMDYDEDEQEAVRQYLMQEQE